VAEEEGDSKISYQVLHHQLAVTSLMLAQTSPKVLLDKMLQAAMLQAATPQGRTQLSLMLDSKRMLIQ